MHNHLYITGAICLFFLLLMDFILFLRVYGRAKVRRAITSKKFKVGVAVLAGIIMYYTPEDIDKMIIAILSVFGIAPIIITPED